VGGDFDGKNAAAALVWPHDETPRGFRNEARSTRVSTRSHLRAGLGCDPPLDRCLVEISRAPKLQRSRETQIRILLVGSKRKTRDAEQAQTCAAGIMPLRNGD
jgi:hypothetical protein